MSPIEIGGVITVGAAVAGAAVSAWFSSAAARRDAQAVRVGERLGALEKRMDIEDGRRLGAAEERTRGSNGR